MTLNVLKNPMISASSRTGSWVAMQHDVLPVCEMQIWLIPTLGDLIKYKCLWLGTVAMKHNVYIMASAQTKILISQSDMCPLVRYCVVMCLHSNYCVDRFWWFSAVSLIHYTYMYGLIYQVSGSNQH